VRFDRRAHITDAGLDELHRWLSTPLPHQDYREAFLIQVYFGGKLDDKEIMPLLDRMIQDLEVAQGQLTAMYRMYLEKMEQVSVRRDLFFSMLTLEYGLTSNQTALDWLNSVLNRLKSGAYNPLEFERLIA